MRYANAAGDVLELTGLDARHAVLRLTPADPLTSPIYHRYEYWERMQAIADFETWVAFVRGGVSEEAA